MNGWRCAGMVLWMFGYCSRAIDTEPLSITHWGTDQGFGPGAMACFLQSRDGYFWLGSEEGLLRFDGVRCTVFNPRNTPELRVKLISALQEDERGGLWVGTAGGGLAYRGTNGDWAAYGSGQGLQNEQVTSIALDASGAVWVGTDGDGIFIRESHRFRPFAGNDSLPSKHIEQLVAADGDIWVSSAESLCRIRSGKLDKGFAPDGTLPTHSRLAKAQTPGSFWVGGKEGIFLLRKDRLTPVVPGFKPGRVYGLCAGADGQLWVGTSDGLVRIHGDRAVRFTTDDGLSGNLVQAICRDAEGSLWIATDVTGADQIRFTKFSSLTVEQRSAQPVTTGVYEDSQGALWVGSHRGVNRIQGSRRDRWTRNEGLCDNLVFTICEGAPGEIWVGTYRGLNRLNNGVCERVQHEVLAAAAIWCLYRDRAGKVWAGTSRGLFRIGEDGIVWFNHDNSGLSHDDVRCVVEDAREHLWAGTSYGLNLLQNGRFTNYFGGGPEHKFNTVVALHADAQGDLWVGTMGQGLFRFRNGSFSAFDRQIGLHDNIIFCILEDDHANLWMSCNRGVFRVSKAELDAYAGGKTQQVSCTVFRRADGLPSTECNGTFQPAGWKTRDGRLWFPTAKGLAVVNPENLPRNELTPSTLIETVHVDGKTVPSSLGKIGPGVSELLIEYTAPSFVAPEAVRFKYRLEGLDSDWLSPTAGRTVRYTHLPPGHYTFQVIACNSDGVWHDRPATLAFQVLPYWWQTRWFLFAMASMAAASIGGAARLWTVRSYHRRMVELEREHALDRERMRIASDLHDDIGSNLGTIALLSEAAKKEAPPNAASDFQEIQQLAQSTAEKMREIVWFVQAKEDELQGLVLRMKETAGRLLLGLSWVFHAPDCLPRRRLSTEFKRHFFLIFKEALHNVRKHAQATSVRIEMRLTPDWIELCIQDNGIGFREPASYAGTGLSSMRRRAAALGWNFTITTVAGGGTRLRVQAAIEADSTPRVRVIPAVPATD